MSEPLSMLSALLVKAGIAALLFNEVRVAIKAQDEAMAKMREELERLSARTH